MPSTSQTKITKDGKISFVLPEDLKDLIILSIRYRIDFTEVTEYLHHLLLEAIDSLTKEGRIKMRKSEFFAVFSAEQMRYMESYTMNLVRAHLGTLSAPIVALSETNHFFLQQTNLTHESE
jgi:hypothetical protein